MRLTESTEVSVSPKVDTTIPLGTFPAGMDVPVPAENSSPLEYAEALGGAYLSFSKHNHTEHDKLPDVVLYDEERNWLFLVEAVTSHGPVTPKRFEELEATLEDCTAARVYVSAFPDFRQFKRHADDVAWETEVWLAEIPDHLIHFNGDKFLGPGQNASR